MAAKQKIVYRTKKAKKIFHRRHIKHAAVTVGAMGTIIGLALSDKGGGSPVEKIIHGTGTWETRIGEAWGCTWQNLKDPAMYIPVLAGGVISSGKNIPVLSLAAKPADRFLMDSTRQRWGL